MLNSFLLALCVLGALVKNTVPFITRTFDKKISVISEISEISLQALTDQKDGSSVNKTKKDYRYIHPQVYKMFQRAQQLARQGDNVVARKLLLRCVELNPYDSHRYYFLFG